MAIDYTQKEQECLVDLISHANADKPLSTSQVTFGTPSVHASTDGHARNTLIIATAVQDRGYSGSQTFYYNRLNLSEFIDPDTMSLEYVIDQQTKLSDLLPEINERYKINLELDKIFDEDLPTFDDGTTQQTVELKVTADSLVYLGSLNLVIKPKEIPLASAAPIVDMDGLTYAVPQAA